MRLIALGIFAFCLSGFSLEIEVQGHRGGRALCSENTLPAFMAGIEAGADVLELDVLASSDGELVIHHDFFINQEVSAYLDGKPVPQDMLVRSLTLTELKQFEIGKKAHPEFPEQRIVSGTQIPALQELFDLLNKSSHPNAKKVRLNLELKRDLRFPEWTLSPQELAISITSLVKKNELSDRVYYSSFDPEVLAAVRRVDPQAEIGFIFSSQSLEVAKLLHPEDAMEFLLQIATLLHVKILSPDHELLKSKEDVSFLQKRGFRVIPWTVNDPARWAELASMGVDGMISDNPQKLVDFLEDPSKYADIRLSN